MPFGRYRGYPLAELPDEYLDWLFTIHIREPLASALNREAARRAGESSGSNGAYTGPIHHPAGVDPEIASELVTAGYRVLAQRYHPDVGGEVERMKRVNVTAEALRRMLAVSRARQ